jgi:hypothetical protein
MFARLLRIQIRGRCRRLGGHVIRIVPKSVLRSGGHIAPEFLGIVERSNALSSPLLTVCCEFVTGYLAWFKNRPP